MSSIYLYLNVFKVDHRFIEVIGSLAQKDSPAEWSHNTFRVDAEAL